MPVLLAQAMARAPRPKRPGFGKVGTAIKVSANHFHVLCRLNEAYHYDVTITQMREFPSDARLVDPMFRLGGLCIFELPTVNPGMPGFKSILSHFHWKIQVIMDYLNTRLFKAPGRSPDLQARACPEEAAANKSYCNWKASWEAICIYGYTRPYTYIYVSVACHII